VKKVKAFLHDVVMGILPLVTDTNPDGKRKVSIGRMPLFFMLAIMIWNYATKGVGPDNQVLAFIGMAMAYNGFGKTKAANGNGGDGSASPSPFPDGEGT
jgi:hypothetical protein